jgi:hypothetical protein
MRSSKSLLYILLTSALSGIQAQLISRGAGVTAQRISAVQCSTFCEGVVELSRKLDASWAGANEDEVEELVFTWVVGARETSTLQALIHFSTEPRSVLYLLEEDSILIDARYPEGVGHRANSDDAEVCPIHSRKEMHAEEDGREGAVHGDIGL